MNGSLLVGLMIVVTLSPPPAASVVAGSTQAPAESVLRISGKVPKQTTLDAEALGRLPRLTVRVKDRDGKESAFEGVELHELLKAAGLDIGSEDLRGGAMVFYLVVQASDGYQVVFSLPELSPDFTDRHVILADRCDGKPLSAKEGPYRVVAPGEKRHARWVRQVVNLKVARDPETQK